MFRPMPDIFLGSSPQDGVSEHGLPEVLNASFSVVAVLGALAVWVAAYMLDGHADPFSVLKLSSAVLLAISLPGAWLVGRAASEQRRVVTRIYGGVSSWMTHQGRLAVPNMPERGVAVWAGLIGQLANRSRRLAHIQQAAQSMRRALCSGRTEAARLAINLREEAGTLNEAAAHVDTSQSLLTREIAANAGTLALGEMAVGRAADAVDRLTDRVQATTACMEQMTLLAVRLSEVAHATHKAVANDDDRSNHLVVALDQVERAMDVMVRLANEAAQRGALIPAGDDGLARIAHDMSLAAGQCQPALAAAHAVVRDLVSETAAANRRVIELGEMVAKQHEFGQAVGHAVQQQAADISAALTNLYEARSGFAVLRASVDAVTRAGALRGDAAGKVREAALRLPSRAERIAEILRGIPDFGQSADI